MRGREGWRSAVLGAALVGLLAAGARGQDLPTREGLVTLDHARLLYEVVGTGEPIIVVPGVLGLDHNYLRPGLDVLASAGHSLVYYDQRGTGLSTAQMDSVGINLPAVVDDVDALRQVLGSDSVTVLGHSFGALVALEYALRYPEHVRALILMDPPAIGPEWKAETQQRIQAARTPADSAALDTLMASAGFKARDPAVVSEVERLSLRCEFHDTTQEAQLDLHLSEATARNAPLVDSLLQASARGIDFWAQLDSVQAPTLVLQGRYDVVPVAMARALADSLPHGRLAVLDSGHFPYIEDAPGLVSAVSVFLQDLRQH